MEFEVETTIRTLFVIDDEAGSAEVSSEVHCTAPLMLAAKNEIGALVAAHIIDEMAKGFDDE